eukprot:NODE_6781_length_818_cov_66.414388_g6545_i0.p2 GENE.NODE_6781_length_818_cov_66.414388_g6545_i0~~NODE_6781_length_818_cov_66.414388_g6545_i0.p2  ORF type:complete len:137 (+),score=50.09 NODE_6781_length_818_cov_66.414388_g6545_i0:202-612(+)
MKADWEKLASEYDSSSVLIGDVDCTEHQETCSEFGVNGYPTIKYWESGSTEAQDYSGGRDYDSLSKHVQDKLQQKCDIKDEATCDAKEVAYIAKMKAKGGDGAKKEQARLEGMAGNKMTGEQKQWLMKRIHILKQL